jgi:hypothetical protein
MANPAVNTDFQIATQASGVGGLVTLASLGIYNPHPIYKMGVSKVKLGNNASRLLGAPNVEWVWGFLQASQRDTLRTYIPGASADLFIITPTIEKVSSVSSASQRYECQAIWPDPETPEDPQTGRRLQFIITFRQLVNA